MPTVLLHVQGLRTSADEQRLEAALRAEQGVYGAVVNREDQCAEVDIDDDLVTVNQLISAADTAGFRAVLGG
jgi:copper chaperone CopZ